MENNNSISRAEKRHGMRLMHRLFLLALSILMIGSFSGCTLLPLALKQLNKAAAFSERMREKYYGAKIEEETVAETTQEPAFTEPAGGGVYTVLLLGSDRRDTSWYGNADSMILLSVNYDKKTLSVISLMRDTGAVIPGVGYRKMNAALAIGGPSLAVQTIAENFNISINGYIFCDFPSMIKIVDLFGGVGVQLSDAEASYVGISTGGGFYNLNGSQTLAHCRNRSVGNSDFDRTARQRNVLSILHQKMQAMSLTELANLAEQIKPLVLTDIGPEAMALLIPAVTKSGYTVVMDRIPYDGLYSYGPENIDPVWPETIARLRGTLY